MLRELSDRRVREDVDLANLGGIPLLAKIPKIKAESRTDKSPSPMLARVEPSAV
jgi:hypothetical protein